MISEFDLIRRYFSRPTFHTDLGVGDDAALFRARSGMQLVVSTDTLIAEVHFLSGTDPEDLGWKTLAVSLSDLAAMGAEPRWATLSLTLPRIDENWLNAFSNGFYACAARYNVDLVGGDTTRGPLALNVCIVGEVPAGNAITRAGAKAGDDLWVSGLPGRAALGLAALKKNIELNPEGEAQCLSALHHPEPRVGLGMALRGIATAMLDISDGLAGDLRHLAERSGVGAVIEYERLPLLPLLAAGADETTALRCALAGGDDYELLFTASPVHRPSLAECASLLAVPLTRIGYITADKLLFQQPDGHLQTLDFSGYDHFG